MENNENNPVPGFMAPPPTDQPTKEQQREVAQKAVDAAKAALDEARKSVEAAQKAKAEAQKIIDGAKPAIMRAEARLDLAKADLLEFGPVPKEKTEGSPSVLEAVKKVLAESLKQMTVLEIAEALKEHGVESDPDNLKAYMARWAKTGAFVLGEKANKFEPARYYLPPTSNGTPAFLTGGAQTPPPPPPMETEFPEDFPGRVPLMEAGITSPADLAGKTEADLLAIPGIGKGTAGKILAAV